MVNGPVGPRRVDAAYLAAIRQILTAARDPSSLRTKELLQLSRKGTTDEIKNAATELQDIIIQSVKVGELDFTAVASRGADLLLEINHQLTELAAQKARVDEELAQSRSALEEAGRQLQETQTQISSSLADTETRLREAQEELSRRPTTEAYSALERMVAQHLQTIDEKNDEIISLSGRLAELKSKEQECKRCEREALKRNRELAERIALLEGEKAAIESSMAVETTRLQDRANAAVSAQQAAEFALARSQSDKAAVNRELLAAQARLQERTDTIQALERTKGEIDQARLAALSHQDDLRRAKDEAVARQGQLEGEVSDLRLRIADAERIRKEKIDTERELSRLRTEVGQLRRDLGQAREDLERAKNDPEIAGIRSRISEMEGLLGEKESALAEARTRITQYEGTLSEKEFDHTQKSGEMAVTLRTRTEERNAAQAELSASRTELERFRQWAEWGMRAFNETLPGLKIKMEEYEAVLARLRQELQASQDETAKLRSTPRKLPPALTLLAELKEKDPKAYQFVVHNLIAVATRHSEEAQKVSGPPIASIGNIQKTLRSPEVTQAVEIEEFRNRAIIATDTVLRTIEIIEKDNKRAPGAPSSVRLLNKLHRFFANPETSLEEMIALVEFLEKIIKTPALVPTLMKQIEEIEASQVDENGQRKALLLEIEYLANPANENEYQNRSQILYRNYQSELEGFLNDPSIDDTTKVTIRKIISGASLAAEESISFGAPTPDGQPGQPDSFDEPTHPEGKPQGFGSKLRGWFSKKT